jgi:tRNA(fMet)-specific endonuclease VapC
LTGYLLDTNIVSAPIHEPRGRLAQRVARAGEANVFTSVIVAAQLRYGALKKASARLVAAVDELLSELEVKPMEPPADKHYGRLRASLEAAGAPIGANDMLLAAHALALEATLVTDNEGEFARVDGLMVENWLR